MFEFLQIGVVELPNLDRLPPLLAEGVHHATVLALLTNPYHLDFVQVCHQVFGCEVLYQVLLVIDLGCLLNADLLALNRRELDRLLDSFLYVFNKRLLRGALAQRGDY